MNKYLIATLCLFSLIVNKASCQEAPPSRLYEAYKKDKNNSLLPDFSYAGYHCGEKAIPEISNYKIFNVTDFGAIPNDNISDRDAIQAAIDAANKNGSGIVFFPKGRFLVNEDPGTIKGIVSKGSNIIFRGSGSGPGGTELFMKEMLLPTNPQQMWTGRPMFTFTANGKDKEVAKVKTAANVGDFELTLNNTGQLKAGDWIALKMLNNSPELIDEALAKHQLDKNWKYLADKGVDICMYYQVVKTSGKTIMLQAPIAVKIDPKYGWTVSEFSNAEEVGIEDIAFVGNWKEKFVHHGSWKDDSGFNLFSFSRCTNSWMKNCRFTDCNIAAMVTQCANVTVMNCVVTGNEGHEAISSSHSTNILLAHLKDEAAQWHSFGVQHGSVNTVIWHCTYPSTTCFESHASQPINSLFDNVTGGFMSGRQGGAMENLPNHLKGLILWNYTQTSAPVKDFDFWPENEVWFKMVQPVIVGFMSKGSTFKTDQLGYLEGLGQKVSPASLYEAQLQLRLKKEPDWLIQQKSK